MIVFSFLSVFQFLQINSLVGFVASVLNDGLHKVDDDDIDQVRQTTKPLSKLRFSQLP